MRPGDIVTEVQGEPVSSVSEFQEAVKGQETGSAVRFYLTRVGRGGTDGFLLSPSFACPDPSLIAPNRGRLRNLPGTAFSM